MFPGILLLYGWWKRGRIGRRDLVASAAFFVISGLLGLVGIWFQHHHAIDHAGMPMGGPLSRLAVAGQALWFYFCKCVLPIRLMPIYPRWSVDPPTPAQFLPWLLFAALLLWSWTRRTTWGRHVWFGGGCFFLNLLPVLGFVSFSYMQIAWVADHFAYLPLIGAIGLAAAAAAAAVERLTARAQPWAFALAGLVVALLAFQSRNYARVFRDEESLWSYAIRLNPDAGLAHNNLGRILAQSGQRQQAMEHFQTAARLRRDDPAVHNNLGSLLQSLGRIDEALEQYEAALRLAPDFTAAQFNLANLLFSLGRHADAVPHFEAGLRYQPDFLPMHYRLAVSLTEINRTAEAIPHFEQALRAQNMPDPAAVRCDFGDALAKAGHPLEAMRQYDAALRIKPDFSEAHYRIGNLLVVAGRDQDAIGHLEDAIRMKPGFALAQGSLAFALAQVGRTADAIGHYREALRLMPDSADLHKCLADALSQTGQVSEAIASYQAALRLRPDYARG